MSELSDSTPSPASAAAESTAASDGAGTADPESLQIVVGEVAVLAGIAAMLVLDLLADVRAGQSLFHMELEAGSIVAALAGIIWVLRRWRSARRALEARVRDLSAHLSESRADAARWQAEAQGALSGLAVAISRQFERWQLTDAERDVGLLILKGLSLKEIAALRGTSERTVRQQSLSVYRKAGLSGRAELSAFFLEELLLPPAPRESAETKTASFR